jgi:hypothetical protein
MAKQLAGETSSMCVRLGDLRSQTKTSIEYLGSIDASPKHGDIAKSTHDESEAVSFLDEG